MASHECCISTAHKDHLLHAKKQSPLSEKSIGKLIIDIGYCYREGVVYTE